MAFIFARNHRRGKTWYVGYYVNGRFVRKRVGRSKTITEKARGDIEARIERADVGLLNRDYPILQFFEEYLARIEGIHAPDYHNRNERVIKQFKRFLEAKRPYLTKLSQLRPEVIEEYQRFRLNEVVPHSGKPIKKRTVNIEVSSLKTFLNKAVKWDILSVNPLEKVEYLKEDDSKKIRSLTEEDVRRLLSEANGWFRPILLTALYTGLREGELICLEWDDVDLENGIIRIRRKPGWIPKSSGRTIREMDIAIPGQFVDFLKDYKRRFRGKDNRVFHNKDGEQLKPGLRKALMRLTRKCGFPEVTQLHALRHTYATHLIKACRDLTVAQEQLAGIPEEFDLKDEDSRKLKVWIKKNQKVPITLGEARIKNLHIVYNKDRVLEDIRGITLQRDGQMALRWTASALFSIEKRMRRIMGYQQLWMLEAALKESETEKTLAAKERVA